MERDRNGLRFRRSESIERSMPEKHLRILVVDDQPNVRRAVRGVLAARNSWEVCGEAADGREAVERAGELRPDVVIMDMSMPRLSGLEATRQIRKRFPESQVLILTFHDFPGLGQLAREAGAKGCVLKGNSQELLIRAVESVSDANPFFQTGDSATRAS
jgi:DNA-binding NarL/FixJ family response regulator